MLFRPLPLHKQVVVITGATSGIGLATARMAADAGASLVLAARSQSALERLREELAGRGCAVIAVPTDVGRLHEMQSLADCARERFGRVDTWINNAGAGIFGRAIEVSAADRERLFDTTYWGVVHGSQVALPLLKAHGGTLINMGSAFADRAAPLHSYYSAAKHAVKAYTVALRMETEQAGFPVAVCLVTPAAIDTMFSVHARNYLDRVPKLPPPQYAPQTVATAILYLAVHPRPELRVGSTGAMLALGSRLAPRLTDRLMELLMFRLQKTRLPAAGAPDALHQSMHTLQERSGRTALVREHSMYGALARHPVLAGSMLAGGMIALGLWRRRAASGAAIGRADHGNARGTIVRTQESVRHAYPTMESSMDKRTQEEAGKSNMVKNPEDWTTGDEPMTGAQKSYLKTLSEEAGEEMDDSLSKAAASKRIDELQQKTGRGVDGGARH